MSDLQHLRRRELEQLRLQLEEAGRLLDEIERRTLRNRTVSEFAAVDRVSNLISENAEERFAARVATGMSKVRQGHSH